MMRNCRRSKSYNFQLLLNDPLFFSNPTSEIYTNNKEDLMIDSFLDFDEKEIYSLTNNMEFGRVAFNLKENHK